MGNISLKRFLKQADPTADAFTGAVQHMAANQIRSDALKDIGSMALLGGGVGIGARGLVGLLNMLKGPPAKKRRSGPAATTLPFPAKIASFLSGSEATSKAGIPWYGPAMLGVGLGSLGLGWKGLDTVLQRRRKKEMENELTAARQQFHDALIGSYAKPVAHPALGDKNAAASTDMTEAGAILDELFGKVAETLLTKKAIDLPNTAGAALGGYGMYAGLSGLMLGSLVYDRMRKRSRRAILDKAMQRRQRRKFMQSPSEIYATPEPIVEGAIEG